MLYPDNPKFRRGVRGTPWRDTPQGLAAYDAAKARAQALANKTGFDHGVECADLVPEWRVFMLPMRQNRFGHELRCEVVPCMNPATCQLGHGSR